MMTLRHLLPTGLLTLATLYLAGAAYNLHRLDIEQALVCADEGGLLIPAAAQVCRAYVFQLRGTADDIARLQAGAGMGFVVQGRASAQHKAELVAFFQARGLDINQPDAQGWLPLHASILARQPDEVAILLAHGADPLRVNNQQQTALALAQALQQRKPDTKMQRIIALLQARPAAGH
ncbi:ankyrin repeat domain-containing protein [Chitinibacter sp. FCG-7]|uniref:Ankyrin repeat domain-containing protein n=1 Tax=Chitinibacter mangrovi TaxID=3153927 RepID=A0AAU7FDS5_9NEIS